MPITIEETPDSGQTSIGPTCSHQRIYVVKGATTESEAQDSLLATSTKCPQQVTVSFSSGVWNDRVFVFDKNGAVVKPMFDGSGTLDFWQGTVDWVLSEFQSEPYQEGDSLTTFTIGFSAVNRKIAISQVASYGATGITPADVKGGINVTADSVEGVDVDTPTFRFTEVHYVANGDMTEAYVNAIYGVALAPVNNAEFRGFAAGSVRFVGLSGTRRTKNGDWELNFEFAVSPNSTDAAPASGIASIVKKGWEYLWFAYDPTIDTASKVQHPRAAYVDKVYNESDFSDLGIGTASLFL